MDFHFLEIMAKIKLVRFFLLIGLGMSLWSNLHAQIAFPDGNVLNLITSKDYLYDETRILFNTGMYKADDYRYEKVMDSLDARWIVTACFNGDCKLELLQSGSFIKDFGVNDSSCFIAFHVESKGFDGKTTIQYKVFNSKNSADSAILIFHITYFNATGVLNPQGSEEKFLLYPNPADEKLWVNFQSVQTEKTDLLLRNLFGQKIDALSNYENRNGTTQGEINTSGLLDGFYFLEIVKDGKTSRQKFLVQHH